MLFARKRPRNDDTTFNVLQRSTAKDPVSIFKEVVTYARDVMRLEIDASLGNANLPKAREQDREGAAKPRVSISLTRARAVAAHMHVVHQFDRWIMRVLGLRIGEAFGIRVEDVTDLGEHAPGLVFIHRQGGRVFRTEGPDGQIVKSDEQEFVVKARG
ncbi:hypothetical protein [Nocardioides daphniae]|nr:hypothetical protein [Nocardioides daphniae]GGD20787.1 hypothetical protein GCM10007231_19920 [Nocardioides daphniae]